MTDLDRAAHPFAVWPAAWDLSGYKYVFSSGSYIVNAYMITILRTLAGTLCNMLFTAALAFVLSNRDIRCGGRSPCSSPSRCGSAAV